MIKWKHIAETYSKRRKYKLIDGECPDKLPEVTNLTSISSDKNRFTKINRNTVNGNDESSSDLYQANLENETGNRVDDNAAISLSVLSSISLKPKQLSSHCTKRRKQQEGTCQKDGDSDDESEEKYKNVSFADMLMMPLLKLKNKKKVRKNLLVCNLMFYFGILNRRKYQINFREGVSLW